MTADWRPDVDAKIAGRYLFAGDLADASMLHGVTVRSTEPHGRIVGLRTDAAANIAGVVRVFTAADVPGARQIGHIVRDQPVFADRVVRHEGEPIAFVVATSARAAAAAAALVEVDIEPLPVLDDPEFAQSVEAPRLHPGGNVYRRLVLRRGDPTFTAPVTVRGEWSTGRQDQLFLAPESGVAVPTDAGGVVLDVATQDLHADRAQIAAALALPEELVHVRLAGVGGAFGGREDITLQIHLCLAAHVLRRAVTATYTRRESFLAHPKRHPARLRYELGADHDGRLLVVRADVLLDGGAYASTSAPVLGSACYFAAGPYRIPNVEIRGASVATNNPISGAMRGFGAVQACFGIESTIDLLAAELGIDPIELRRINALRPGDPFPTSGQRVGEDAAVLEVIDRCAALPMPCSPPGRDRVRGVGFALGVKSHLYGEGMPESAEATIRVDRNGATIVSAATECGQGLENALVRLASDVLDGIPVTVAAATSAAGYAGSSSASRATWMSGGAVGLAARAVLEVLTARAAGVLESEPCIIGLDRGRFIAGDRSIGLAELLGDDSVTRTSTYHAPPTERGDEETGAGDVHVSWMFVAHRAVVDLDPELGTIDAVQVATAQHVGRVVDEREVVGQIRGGISQGVGLALSEHLSAPGGRVVNAGTTDYLIPTAADMPDVVVALVEHPDPRSPHGGKGVGEPPSLSSTAAVAAAVRAASGRPIRRVPIRFDDVCG